ncbi:ATP-dependent DNA helicase MER3 [Coemansia javaensis]|uniref:ATP-dependent DNA helicase MER3 n=1 Tax=Coemansia javaensis TaxID=2761396 RepID=A0A9W8HGP8_9FUNG|nr:ATP-dependent DNA helicase MER3 [Coemansia javaensis]
MGDEGLCAVSSALRYTNHALAGITESPRVAVRISPDGKQVEYEPTKTWLKHTATAVLLGTAAAAMWWRRRQLHMAGGLVSLAGASRPILAGVAWTAGIAGVLNARPVRRAPPDGARAADTAAAAAAASVAADDDGVLFSDEARAFFADQSCPRTWSPVVYSSAQSAYFAPKRRRLQQNNATANIQPSRTDAPPRALMPPTADAPHLVPVSRLPPDFASAYPFGAFNRLQSACFADLFDTDANMVISAPTASGKTVLMEIAMCRLFRDRQARDAAKALYLAPLRALCAEKVAEWSKRFEPSGIQCVEAVGSGDGADADGDAGVPSGPSLARAHIICATPEKWVSLARRPGGLACRISLVLLDECHMVGTSRGAQLELAVASIRTHSSRARIVAASATVGNIADISRWLSGRAGSPAPAKTLVFGDEFRPVPLAKVVLGYECRVPYYKFQRNLDFRLPGILNAHCPGGQVLIFCSTRGSAQDACLHLARNIGQLAHRPAPLHLTSPLTSQLLNESVPLGVAFHHAGLSASDRQRVEQLFLSRSIAILCSTSTLGIGVNLPASAVIVKGTRGYMDSGYAEYASSEVLQFIGRAGRPQFGASGKAIVLTEMSRVGFYRSLVSGQETLESSPSYRDVLETVCKCSEFGGLRITAGQKSMLNEMNGSAPHALQIHGRISTIAHKVFVLLWFGLQRKPLPQSTHAAGLSKDMGSAFVLARGPAMCIRDVYADRGDAKGVLASSTLESAAALLCQVDGIGPRYSGMLWNSGVASISQLRSMGAREIEHLLNRNPPFGTKVVANAAKLPDYAIDMAAAWIDPNSVVFTIRVSSRSEGGGEDGQSTAPFTVVAYTSDGLLLKFESVAPSPGPLFYETQAGLCNPTPGSSAILERIEVPIAGAPVAAAADSPGLGEYDDAIDDLLADCADGDLDDLLL